MKAITLRNLPPEIEKAIEERAAKSGESLNKAVIGLLQEAVKPAKSGPPYHDLDFLIGTMDEEEARIMWESLREQRRIFPEDWPGHKLD